MRNIRLDPAACLWWAVLLLVLPLRWLLAALVAATVHEMGHLLAVTALGGRVLGITVGPGGAALETSPMEPWRELVCTLAGPLGGILLMCFARLLPLAALCALVQTLFNLLPIYPLDGGRALRCAVELLFPQADAQRFCRRAGMVFAGGALLLGAFAAVRFRLGGAVLIPFFLLLGNTFPRKRPCKTASLRLQ